MFTPVLSVLLMGMLPALGGSSVGPLGIYDLPIAPPSPLVYRDGDVPFEVAGRFSASGVLIADFDSGQVLYEVAGEEQRPMASLAKLMTALIIAENYPDQNAWVTVPESVENINGNSVSLSPGQRFTVGDLLSALLIMSLNDAAQTLAVHHSGSAEAFAVEMNKRAEVLGLKNTNFANPVGLDDTDQWSTPRDMAWLTRFAMRSPVISTRMGQRSLTIRTSKNEPLYLTHTHATLQIDRSIIAGKTGTTNGANQCLISVVEENGHTYLVVLLNSLQRYKDMSLILEALRTPSIL